MYLPIAVSLALIVSARSFLDEGVSFPDGDRLMMDGVFIADYLRDTLANGFLHPMAYAEQYYAQYPALSIGYKPPLWPAIQSLLNLPFGPYPVVPRICLLILAGLSAAALFQTIRRYCAPQVAFMATVLTMTTPYLVQWYWYPMTEAPVMSFIILAAWSFTRYAELRKNRDLIFSVLFLAGAAWIKQPAAYAALWLFLFALLTTPSLLSIKQNKAVWLAAIGFLMLLVPVGLLTLEFGALNIDQSVGRGQFSDAKVLAATQLLKHPWYIFTDHLTLPVLVLATGGLMISIAALWRGADIKKRHGIILFLMLIVSTYVAFTTLSHKIPRYSFFWIPSFGFFSALFLDFLSRRVDFRFGIAVFFGVAAFNIFALYERPVRSLSGPSEAVEYVLKHSKSPIVFVDAYENGVITYFFRQRDTGRTKWVIRGDKLLSSTAISGSNWLEVHAKNRGDIRKIFRSYGIQMILVEKNNLIDIPIHDALREYLRTDEFDLVAEFDTASSVDSRYNNGQSLQVYKFRDWQPPTADEIVIRIPTVGKTIRVPFQH